MEHIAALLLIVGCSGDLAECRELPAPTPLYESMQECDEQIGDLRRALEGARPRVFAQCIYVDPAMAEENAELVWDITAEGKLEAEVIASSGMVASTDSGDDVALQQ